MARIHIKQLTQKKNKYGAKKTVVNGFTFDSKLEADYYKYLLSFKTNNPPDYSSISAIKNIFRQVPIQLAPKSKLVVDFLVHFWNGDLEFSDTKGFMTSTSATKIKVAEHLYGIKINIIKRGDF